MSTGELVVADQYSFKLLCKDVEGLTPKDIEVEFSLTFNRLTDAATEEQVASTWHKRMSENPTIFDGKKFRIHDVIIGEEQQLEGGGRGGCRKKPKFLLGLTSYREYLGTNMSEMSEELQHLGVKLNGNCQAYLSDPMGVGSLIVTTDNKFVLIRRSHLCSEAQGLLDGPGGHAEPHMVSGLLEDTEDKLNDKIVNEIFDSILREIVDEVNIERSALSEAKLLGVIYNHTTANRCSLLFLVKSQLHSDEIYANFKLGGHSEAEESTDVTFVDVSAVLMSPPPSGWQAELTPSCQAAFEMFRLLHA